MTYRFGIALLLALTIAIVFASCRAEGDAGLEPEVRQFTGGGVVLTITPSRNFVNIDHGDIPGFMEPMAMTFAVADTSVLTGISVRDSVAFDVQVSSQGTWLTRVERVAP